MIMLMKTISHNVSHLKSFLMHQMTVVLSNQQTIGEGHGEQENSCSERGKKTPIVARMKYLLNRWIDGQTPPSTNLVGCG